MPFPSDEAREARRQAKRDLDEARKRESDAAEKLAEAVQAVARLRDHKRADLFVAMVQKALERNRNV